MDLKYNTLNHSLYESLPTRIDILRSLSLVPGHGLNKWGQPFLIPGTLYLNRMLSLIHHPACRVSVKTYVKDLFSTLMDSGLFSKDSDPLNW